MSFTATIDISTFIWSEDDFNSNKNQYITLKNLVPNIYSQIKELQLPILLRQELYESIMNEFPYNMVKEIGYDFQRLTMEFLTDTFLNWVLYEENSDNTITSIPVLVKSHFTENVRIETQSQVSHLFYNGKNPEHKFITYDYFFNQKDNLVLDKLGNIATFETFQYNSEEAIIQFFENHKIKFKHNPKHDNYKSGGNISPLSCYNERIGDNTKAQNLFEKAYKIDNDFFYFDEENNVYVKFVSSNDGTYHGFDISDEKSNVPSQIKSKFNKNGRIF